MSDLSWMGQLRGLTQEELHTFLSRPLIARIATISEDGYPYVAPLFHYFDGEDIYLRVREKAEFMRNILRDPRIALSIADVEPAAGWPLPAYPAPSAPVDVRDGVSRCHGSL